MRPRQMGFLAVFARAHNRPAGQRLLCLPIDGELHGLKEKSMTQPASASSPMAQPRRGRVASVGRWLIALLLPAGLAFWGSIRIPTGPAAGDTFASEVSLSPTTDPATLRLATFNIDSGRGRDGKIDLGKTAQGLAGFDIVSLNEVRGAPFPFFNDANQAKKLGLELKMPWLFAPVERRWWHDDFGSGVLCTLRVLHWQRFPLSGPAAKGNRNLVHVKVLHRGRTVNILITHLDPHEHQAELRAVRELFTSLAEPAVLMGDLNTLEDDAELKKLLATPGVVLASPWPKTPHSQVDWIFLRGLRPIASGTIDRGASDHPLFWAEVE